MSWSIGLSLIISYLTVLHLTDAILYLLTDVVDAEAVDIIFLQKLGHT